MPPKKSKKFDFPPEDLPFDISNLSEESQTIISVLLYAVTNYKNEVNKIIAERDATIKSLNERVKSLENKIEIMENKIDADEANERMNEVVISGKNVPPCSSGENITNVVTALLRNTFSSSVSPSNIVKCHRIGQKPRPGSGTQDRRSIVMKLADSDIKNDLITSSKRVKADGVFICENLSPIRKSIMYVLRRAKREFPDIVSGATSINGNVFVWIKSRNASRDTRMLINNYNSLDRFCTEIINSTMSHFIQDRPTQ